MQTYGYVRVSTADQCVDRQVLALKREGVKEENIFTDYLTGYTFNRPSYKALMSQLEEGDLIIILSLDRLGRNYREILNEWRKITEEIKADIYVIDMPALDTRKSKNLVDNLITDIVLQLLSYVAETEREFILARQSEGIAAAKERGVKFGRPKIKVPKNFESVRDKWLKQEISSREAGQILGVSHTTFLRWNRILSA
jgi:DNA invertase Pin-like site-specific DNA recombinase